MVVKVLGLRSLTHGSGAWQLRKVAGRWRKCNSIFWGRGLNALRRWVDTLGVLGVATSLLGPLGTDPAYLWLGDHTASACPDHNGDGCWTWCDIRPIQFL